MHENRNQDHTMDVPKSPFTIAQLRVWADYALSRGWTIERTDGQNLVPISKNGMIACVDGRPDTRGEITSNPGPKLQGGIYGVAALAIKDGSANGLRRSVEIIQKAGFIPGIHGDSHGILGCGFFRLWYEKKFTDLPLLELEPQKAVDILIKAGAHSLTLSGLHRERKVLINTIPGYTLPPRGDAFNLDLWVAQLFGADPSVVLRNAMETVELLSGPKKAEII